MVVSTVLAACDNTLPAPDSMPPSYGEFGRASAGCPDLTGLYAWPPLDHPRPAVPATGQYGGGAPTFLGQRVHTEAQIWINGPSAASQRALEVRTRMINRDPRYRVGSLSQEWSFGTITYHCEGRWAVWDKLTSDGEYQHSGRMALLADGSLAVGQAARAGGQRGPIFSWGGQTYGDVALPDKVGVGWARLKRIAPTGKDVPADDAYLRRRAK